MLPDPQSDFAQVSPLRSEVSQALRYEDKIGDPKCKAF